MSKVTFLSFFSFIYICNVEIKKTKQKLENLFR